MPAITIILSFLMLAGNINNHVTKHLAKSYAYHLECRLSFNSTIHQIEYIPYNGIQKVRSPLNLERKNISCIYYLIPILIATSNDIQLNPGPSSTTYNCGTCDLPVTWQDKAIMCDTCNQWYHPTCQSIHTKTYKELAENSAIACDSLVCDNPNYSSVYFAGSYTEHIKQI